MFTQPEILMFLIGCTLTMSICVWYYEPKLHRQPKADTKEQSAPARSDHDSFFDQYSAKNGLTDYGYRKSATDEEW